MAEVMSDEEYLETQAKLMVAAAVIRGLDLDGFLERIFMAEFGGPAIDPSLYGKAVKRLDAVKALALKAKALQSVAEDAAAELI